MSPLRLFPRLLAAILLTGLFATTGCKRPAPAPAPISTPEPAATTPEPAARPTPAPAKPTPATPKPAPRPPQPAALHTPPPPADLWKEFSGVKAFEHVQRQVEIGPRPSGSPEAEKAREHISETLKKWGWQIERQPFSSETPRGIIHFVNVIARHAPRGAAAAPTTTQQAIVCSHFDTKRYSTIRFVGASDGASSTGALMEFARVAALDPAFAAKIEFVFFDGEEAVQQFTETDGLYGSRHYAQGLRETSHNRQFKLGILWDMIGDRDLTITLPPDSPPDLVQGILSAADFLGSRRHFSFHSLPITDDHIPLIQSGIPSIDLIDFNYLPWHTADDTIDKLSPDSLEKIGAVTLYYLKKALR